MTRRSSILLAFLAVGLVACGSPTGEQTGDASTECVPESAAELCSALGKDCEKTGATDRCGQARIVHCGLCGAGTVCRANVCAPETHEARCQDGVDDDVDGLTDCDDEDCRSAPSCAPPPPVSCARQSDCGDIVNETVTDVCLTGRCQAPGAATWRGEALTAQVGIRLVFGGTLTGATKPKSAVVRLVDSRRPNGTSLTCAQLQASGNCNDEATRSRIDDDPGVNQVFRSVYALDFTACVGSECVFPSLFATVPRGQGFLLYGEAWYGARDLNEPTGQCAAATCVEGQAIVGEGDQVQLTFR